MNNNYFMQFIKYGYFIFVYNLKIRMIDLLKNYKELRNATDYKGNIRYLLAKKKLDVL